MLKKYFLVFLISMVPLIELRGAIPYSQAFGMPLWSSYIVAIVGNMIPVPFIYLFARKVLIWGADKPVIGKFFTYCLDKGEKGGKKLQEKAGRGLFVALLLFVGIPLPGTGAWTGTLAASFLDMDFKSSVLAVMGGVLLAGVIMGLASARSVRRAEPFYLRLKNSETLRSESHQASKATLFLFVSFWRSRNGCWMSSFSNSDMGTGVQ